MPPASFVRRFRWPILVALLVLGVAVVAPFVYINLIKEDAAERPTLDDVITTTTGGDGSSTTAGGSTDGIDGTWTITNGSVVQYRVTEVLLGQDAEATGVADGVTGTAEISGTTVTAVDVEVDMTTFESPESRRDGQFQGRIMETDEFPTATFTLTEPVDLVAVPADGERITIQATGELTMHGVTQVVTFELTAALNGSTFAAEAAIPITFSDYDIDDPSGGPATVGDEGTLEVLLVFGR
ncbi:MAG: YceI family protein [Acidimicrobiales bacterium]